MNPQDHLIALAKASSTLSDNLQLKLEAIQADAGTNREKLVPHELPQALAFGKPSCCNGFTQKWVDKPQSWKKTLMGQQQSL
jgi:hypothetical protein